MLLPKTITLRIKQDELVPIHKWFFCPISALCSKNNPRNINYMPAVIFFACLDLEQKPSFLDGHELDFQQHDFIRQLNKEIHHAGI
jgi:hypothetical protein